MTGGSAFWGDYEPGERIHMPAHHGGGLKRFGIEDPNEPEGVSRVTGTNAVDVNYFVDSEGGSSGSPVLAAATDRVVALHHTASTDCRFGNNGVRMDLVFAVSSVNTQSA